jgi:ankyrin repeat protein
LEMVEPAGGKKTWVNVFFEHVFLHWLVDVDLVVRLRRVSLEWMDALNHALPLLRHVSFPVGITGEDVLRALGLVAVGGNIKIIALSYPPRLRAALPPPSVPFNFRGRRPWRPWPHTGDDNTRPLFLCVLEHKLPDWDFKGLSDEHMSLISAEHMAWMVARVRERCPGATEIRIEGCDDWAVELAKDEATLEVLKAGGAMMPEITAQNMNGLLIKYASKGAAPLVQLVLQAGANVNHVEKDHTALIKAAWSGHIDVLRILLDAGADVNIGYGNTTPGEGGTPLLKTKTALDRAAESGHIDVVRALLDAGARTGNAGVSIAGYWGDPLLNAAAAGHIDIVCALLDAGALVNTWDMYDETALIKAADAGHIDVVRVLVDAGAWINVKGDCRETALINAAEAGHIDVVRVLVDAGAWINEIDDRGVTALLKAAEAGHIDVVRVLVDAGAWIDEKGGYCGETALIKAAEAGHIDVVRVLVDAGAELSNKTCTYSFGR